MRASSDSVEPRAIARLLPKGNVEGSIYGVILVSSLMATLSPAKAVGATMAALAVTTIVFALAHAWAHAMSLAAEAHAPLDRRALLRSLSHEWAIVQAVVPALLALVPVALGWYDQTTGLWIGLGCNIGLLLIWGAGVRELAGGSRLQVLASALVSGSLGLLLAVLKVVVH
ncbi:MAG TPA: hypothetical protein VI111_01890 [Thermoleophilaceae bacterium]